MSSRLVRDALTTMMVAPIKVFSVPWTIKGRAENGLFVDLSWMQVKQANKLIDFLIHTLMW